MFSGHYCEFTTSGLTATRPGTLQLVDDNPNSDGYFAFLRLVGCTYFNKHKAAFLLSVGSQQQPQNLHEQWIGMIRAKIWSRIQLQYEDDMIPSCETLHRHWRRSCWVSFVWKEADFNSTSYPELHTHGWKRQHSNTLGIVKQVAMSLVRERVALIRKDAVARLDAPLPDVSAKRIVGICGPGCKCLGCSNLPPNTGSQPAEQDLESGKW